MGISNVTREQAEDAIEGLEGLISRGVQSVYLDIAISGMRQLLAAMDSDPVAWRYRTTDINGKPNPRWSFSEEASLIGLYQPLYTHPAQPAPVVPDDVQHVAAVLELIGSFEAADIDSDTVDLRFEIDDVDTGADASITEYSARGAAIIRLLAGNSPVIPSGSKPKSEFLQSVEKLAEDAAALVERVGGATCEWSFDGHEHSWNGKCGASWQFFEDGPEENRMRFCPGCGKPVSIAEQSQDE